MNCTTFHICSARIQLELQRIEEVRSDCAPNTLAAAPLFKLFVVLRSANFAISGSAIVKQKTILLAAQLRMFSNLLYPPT